MNMTRPILDDISVEDSYRMKQAEFKGMVIQSLKDIRSDIAELKQEKKISSWISMAIAGIAGIVSGTWGRDIKF